MKNTDADDRVKQTWSGIVDRYRGLIIGKCVDVMQRTSYLPMEAEDLVQETMIHLWKKRRHVLNSRVDTRRSYIAEMVDNALSDILEKYGGAEEPVTLTPA